MPANKRILMIAGEASGDLLGANLARELLHQSPDLQLAGMGGAFMRQAGVNIVVDNQSLDIIGWWEVVKNFSIVRAAMKKIKKEILKKPDLLILIDYPGFNLRMAKIAKKSGVKILYYVSPQIWAWRYGRIKIIKECVDHVAVLFPFEAEIYRKENIPVTYVGHPLSALIKTTQTQESIYRQYHLNPQNKIIALFPGSRRQEIHRLLPIMMQAIKPIREKIRDAQFILPIANSLKMSDLKPYLTEDVIIVENNTYNILSVCDAAVVKSGTSTLEVALSGVPLLIIYKGNWLNYWIARRVVKITQIGLCNIVAQKKIAQELIQENVTPENITQEIVRLINDKPYRRQILADLSQLRAETPAKENSKEVAEIALKLLNT